MACEQWFDAISASVDGEDPGVDPVLLDAHLASCGSCRVLHDQLSQLRRRNRVRAAVPIPDLSGRIVKLAVMIERSRSWMLVRVFLAVVAIEIAALALPALLLGDEAGSSAHAARHLGAFSVAYAAGLLVVAFRPSRARSILPVTVVLVAALVIGAVVDIAQGRVPLAGEVAHVPEVVSAVLVWALAVPLPARGRAPGVGRTTDPQLRLLQDPDPPDEQQETG